MEVHQHHQQLQVGVENEADFWPVEHPLEPRDEDRPVKCPMPQSSVINVSLYMLLTSFSFIVYNVFIWIYLHSTLISFFFH